MNPTQRRDRLVPVRLTRRQWEIVTQALGESFMGGAAMKGEIHWKTAQALEDATAEIAQAAGYVI